MFRKLSSKNFAFEYPVVLVAVLLAFLILIEVKHPYYFLQDDNRDQLLPALIYNFRSLFINNELPLYNFHQFLGTPYLAAGQPAVLYPLTYLSVFLSSLFLNHPYGSVDIYVCSHFVIGSIGLFAFLKLLGLDGRSAFWGALFWPLSSFVFYVSNSWAVVSGVAAYFPWMLFFSLKLIKDCSLRSLMFLVLVRILFFYIGHIQYFIYAVIFEVSIFFGLLRINRASLSENPGKIIKYYIFSYLLTFVFSLPLLLPMWHQTTVSFSRGSPLGWKEFVSRTYPLKVWTADLVNPSKLAYIGYVSLLFSLISLVYLFNRKIINPIRFYILLFLVSVSFALLWASSEAFNRLIYFIPILNRFRWPFKMSFFSDFFLVLMSAAGIFLAFKKSKLSKAASNIVFIVLVLLQIISLTYPYLMLEPVTFRTHLDKVPLEEPLRDSLSSGRIITVGFNDFVGNTLPTVGFNYATLWGLYQFAGYEPLLSAENSRASLGLNYIACFKDESKLPYDYLRLWGVKWYVASNQVKLKNDSLVPKHKDENRTVHYDAVANPLIYWDDSKTAEGIGYNIKTNSILITASNPRDAYLTINFLFNPDFKGMLDSKPLTINKNSNNQMTIFVPEGTHHIVVKYIDPYFITGCYILILFIILSGIFYLSAIGYGENIDK